MFAARGTKSLALLLLAICTHISLTPCLLLAPLSHVIIYGPQSGLKAPKEISGWGRITTHFTEFLIYLLALFGVSSIVVGDISWVEPTWGAIILLPDLTPNAGLWWYFFTEMFDHFRSFFLVVFSANMFIYVAPICIKFQHDPLYAFMLLVGILGMFKPYMTLADPGLFLSMISLFPETFSHFNNAIVTALLHLHAALLLPLFNRLWLSQGTGNANFFYASTLVFGMANGFAITDCIWAGLSVGLEKRGAEWATVQIYDAPKREVAVNNAQ